MALRYFKDNDDDFVIFHGWVVRCVNVSSDLGGAYLGFTSNVDSTRQKYVC